MNGGQQVRASSVHAAPLSAAELAADESASRAIAERLPRVRAAASAWGATVSAITGLFGAGVVLGGDSEVRALADGWGVFYGVLSAMALTLAGAAILLAARAAEARPVVIPTDVTGRVEAFDAVFDAAVRSLRRSRWCTAGAAVLLVASIGVRWYAPLGLADQAVTLYVHAGFPS